MSFGIQIVLIRLGFNKHFMKIKNVIDYSNENTGLKESCSLQMDEILTKLQVRYTQGGRKAKQMFF